MAKTVIPICDSVLVRRDRPEGANKFGIELPTEAKEKPQRGTVVSVGPGDWAMNGDRVAMQVREGDRVIFGNYAGETSDAFEDDDLIVMSERDVLAVVGE